MNAKTQMCKDGVEGYHPVSLCFVFVASFSMIVGDAAKRGACSP